MSHLLSPACGAGNATSKEKGNIGPQLRGQGMPVGIGQGQAEQPLRADQKPRRVAAPPSQTGSCRDALREPRPDARASREKTRLAEQIPRALDHVGLRTGDRSSADL